jgi:hypothetical protein
VRALVGVVAPMRPSRARRARVVVVAKRGGGGATGRARARERRARDARGRATREGDDADARRARARGRGRGGGHRAAGCEDARRRLALQERPGADDARGTARLAKPALARFKTQQQRA